MLSDARILASRPGMTIVYPRGIPGDQIGGHAGVRCLHEWSG